MFLICSHYKFINCFFFQFQYTCFLSFPIPLLLTVRNIFSVCYIFHNPCLSLSLSACQSLLWSLQLYITSNLSASLAPWPSVFVTPALSPLFTFLLYPNMWYCYQCLFKFIPALCTIIYSLLIFTLCSLFRSSRYAIPLILCPFFPFYLLPSSLCLFNIYLSAEWEQGS
jgi:hypothetical protein